MFNNDSGDLGIGKKRRSFDRVPFIPEPTSASTRITGWPVLTAHSGGVPLADPDPGVGHGMRRGRRDQVLVVDLTEPRLVRRERFVGLPEPLAPGAFPHGTSYRRSVDGRPGDVPIRSGSWL